MKFWDEMQDKWGFNDGESYPEGIEIYRDIYCKVINKLAEQKKSNVRAIPYNRSGCHNYMLICFVTKDWFENKYLPLQKTNKIWQAPEIDGEYLDVGDKEFDKAIIEALEMDVDSWVKTKITTTKEFKEFLAK